ncbi:MAG TPA: OmpA family protein, partial [Bacteroidia bacterium]|nr:OmpA family protein [Bacteroidia bacterium]
GCPDKDGDKIPDKDDDCADVIGLAKYRGCPDADGDGIKDSEDRCPQKPGPIDNRGCPEDILYVIDGNGKVLSFATRGKDGVFRFETLPPDGDFKFRLEGEGTETIDKLNILVAGVSTRAMRMKDGFFKFEKIVADISKLTEEKVIDVPIKLMKEEQEILKKAFDNLEFNTGKDIIRFESYASLDDLGKLMVKKSEWRIKLSGHTDNVGNAKANLTLSQKRAQAVKNFLVDRGIKPERILVEYFGGSKPVADNKTEAGKQKNRRVEMLVIE